MDFDFYSLPLMERWDVVLRWFVISPNSKPNGSIADIVNHMNFLSHHIYAGVWEGNLWYNLKPIVEKLLKDGHISYEGQRRASDDSPWFNVYAITEKGREFYFIDGGYSKDFEKKNQVRNHAEQVEKAMLVNNKWMKIGTLIAAGATSCLVLIELIKHFGWILSINLLTAGFLFSSGICIGTIALLIALQVLRKSKV